MDLGDGLTEDFEEGTELQATIQQQVSGCNGWVLESYAGIDAADAVFHAKVRPDGFGTAALGLVLDQDYDNRIEVSFDNDTGPIFSSVPGIQVWKPYWLILRVQRMPVTQWISGYVPI